MKAQGVNDMAAHVRSILEENISQVGLTAIAGERQLSLDDLIKNMLVPAVDSVALLADIGSFDEPSVQNTTGESVKTFDIPSGVLRILCVSADTWERDVYDLQPTASEMYRIVTHGVVKSVGCASNPAAFVTYSALGKRSVKLYPECKTAKLFYIPSASISTDNKIGCDGMLYEAACFYTAYLVCQSKGYSQAEAMYRQAMKLLGVEPSPQQPVQV